MVWFTVFTFFLTHFLLVVFYVTIVMYYEVMTSVYGVTYIGARKQIQEKIEEKVSSTSPASMY